MELYTAWVTTKEDGLLYQIFVNIDDSGDENDIRNEIEAMWYEVFAERYGEIDRDYPIKFQWTPGAWIVGCEN